MSDWLPLRLVEVVFHEVEAEGPHIAQDTVIEIFTAMDIDCVVVKEGNMVRASFRRAPIVSDLNPVFSLI